MAEKEAAITQTPKSMFKTMEEFCQKNHLQITCDIKQQEKGFVAEIILENEHYTGYGSSKKSAKDNAAEAALNNTAYADNKIQKTPVSELNEISQKDSQIHHTYEVATWEKTEFICVLNITHDYKDSKETYVGKGKSKKDAKQDAASKAITNSTIILKSTSLDMTSAGSYPCFKNQTGFVLIINFKLKREWADKDEKNIIELISGYLKFEYSLIVDPTKEKLLEELKSISNKINDHYTSYYCFIVFIMGHGSQFGIRTSEKEGKKMTITVDDILDQVRNDKIPNFVGKPKMIFVESCRGESYQDTYVQPDGNDDDTIEKISAPTDADIMIAYSTTEGYKSFRQKNVGSIFIYECMKKFKESYTASHIEEMMIDVKAAVARGSIGKANKRVQMPCTWSTLTKRFYFICTKPSQS